MSIDDIRALLDEANEQGRIPYDLYSNLYEALSRAGEAAERKPVVDREALAEKMFYINGNDDWGAASESERQDWLDQAGRVIGVVEAEEKREVRAQALEEFAALEIPAAVEARRALLAHATEIREGRA